MHGLVNACLKQICLPACARVATHCPTNVHAREHVLRLFHSYSSSSSSSSSSLSCSSMCVCLPAGMYVCARACMCVPRYMDAELTIAGLLDRQGLFLLSAAFFFFTAQVCWWVGSIHTCIPCDMTSHSWLAVILAFTRLAKPRSCLLSSRVFLRTFHGRASMVCSVARMDP